MKPSAASNGNDLSQAFLSSRVVPTSPADAIDIDANRRLLNRYRFVQHETMRILAGWLPRIARFELKCETSRTLWENSLHVNAFYLRLREIQSPAFQKPSDSTLVTVMSEMLHAPDEFGLCLALYRVVVPSLIEALATHETATFPNSDLPSVHAIKHALIDLRGQIERVEPLLAEAEASGQVTAAAREWQGYITQLLAHAGGVSGLQERPVTPPVAPASRAPFVAPREARRDERFSELAADPAQMPGEEDYVGHTVEEFERYSTEMLAAETVALVMLNGGVLASSV
ncbi:MAG TPA: hypothetical protein PLN52_22590 [Opitutaceae bacterium]|nr:hypothetical protein [Opitutaceae bacterium]